MGFTTDPEERARIIEGMVQKIVDHCDPAQVILFGSSADGTVDEHSDVDLLVVLREPPANRRRAATGIYRCLIGSKLPKDILVSTPEEVAVLRGLVGTVVGAAAREGTVVHVRGS